MIVRLYEQNPSERELRRIAAALENDGVVICPTDGLYVFGCSLHSPRAIERLRRLQGRDAGEIAVVFDEISRIAEYCRVDNAAFRVLKRNLPGPFTFILPALSRMPDKALGKRRRVGVRIPANAIPRAIVEALDAPLVTAPLPGGEAAEYGADPELLHERYGRETALVVDGGAGDAASATVVDLTGGEPELVREGSGRLG